VGADLQSPAVEAARSEPAQQPAHRIATPNRYVCVEAQQCSLRRMLLELAPTHEEYKMSNFPSAVELYRHSLDTFLAKDMKGWSLLCAEDVVAEFPFAPQGSPRRLEGREALYEYLRNYPSVIDVRSNPDRRIYSTEDPNVVIAEWSVSGEVIANGNAYEMSYATFVTFKDGLIVNYREYWDPLAFMQAMSGAQF
jgi:ketosteroid isomerase-like protein